MSTPPSRFQKKMKVSTLVLESKNIRITNKDKKEFARMIKASSNCQYLSPLGKKMIKELLDNEEPIDLKDINCKVVNADLENLQAESWKTKNETMCAARRGLVCQQIPQQSQPEKLQLISEQTLKDQSEKMQYLLST